MASDAIIPESIPSEPDGIAGNCVRPWPRRLGLSSSVVRIAAAAEQFLAGAGFDRMPWLAVAFATGIGLWFELANIWSWLALLSLSLAIVLAARSGFKEDGRFPFLRQSISLTALMIASGCLVVWAKSSFVGVPAIDRPIIAIFTAEVTARQVQPAEGRVRLILATRIPNSERIIRIRVNVPLDRDEPLAIEGSVIRLKARLMPPASPMLPGGYNFARTAWFAGISATGSALGPLEIVSASPNTGDRLDSWRRQIAGHILARVEGSAGGIATAFATGDRGAISKADEQAMRDSGLTHLLSVSGLHVSAVIAGVYFTAMRVLALWSWLALRVRLPIFAAGAAALAGIGYTLLTGAEVPTVRSCAGAILVLLALALGREPLSLRLLAFAALFVMLLWPEAVVGPSFQMSFASVLAIIALHASAPVRAFTAKREEGVLRKFGREVGILLVTGFVIELALMPIAFYHFHRAGLYGALSNVVAIPLTTFISMPLIALALLLDTVWAGAPVWWLAGKSLDVLLLIARTVAARPGAVNHLTSMGEWRFALFLIGSLWLALWRGRVRLWGLVPAGIAGLSLFALRPPDVFVSGDGHNVGIVSDDGASLMILRDSKSTYARENLTEAAGLSGQVQFIADWPAARCNDDYCFVDVLRGGRSWRLLIGRGTIAAPERELVAACDISDIVIADRWLPQSCRPRWIKADRSMLDHSGGLTIEFGKQQIKTVAEGEGQHSWWHVRQSEKRRSSVSPPNSVPPI